METYYQEMFPKSSVFIVTNGHTEGIDLSEFETKFANKQIAYPLVTSFRAPRELKVLTEETDMQQAIVKMGYVLSIYRHDPLYDAAVVFDIILGGYPESRLFKIIREEEGLCYDISSSYDYYKGVVMLSSGIDLSKVDHALERIQSLVDDMKTKGITEDELMHAKAYYIHQLKASLDSQSTLTKRAFIREMLHYQETIEEKIGKIKNLRRSDIEQVAQMMHLDTIYVLKGGAK